MDANAICGMRLMVLKEFASIPKENFDDYKWHELIFVDPYSDSCAKRKLLVRKINMDDTCKNNIAPNSAMAELVKYFDRIERDRVRINNTICRKGCCDCCTNEFEVSLIEFFTILRFIGIQFGDNAIRRISERAKGVWHVGHCLFVDDTNGACTIYEVRPLICRKGEL